MIRLTGTSSFLPVRVCGTAVIAMMSSGTCRGEACAAMARLDRLLQLVVERGAGGEDDEQRQPVAAVAELGPDHQRLGQLRELVDHGVDVGAAEPDAVAVEGGVRPAGHDHAAALGHLHPVAVPPDAGEGGEVGVAVARAVGVVPEAQRHRRHRLGDDELADLAGHAAGRRRSRPPGRRRGWRAEISPAQTVGGRGAAGEAAGDVGAAARRRDLDVGGRPRPGPSGTTAAVSGEPVEPRVRRRPRSRSRPGRSPAFAQASR